MAKHDLEAINVALRLGDVFTPPAGVVFRLSYWAERYCLGEGFMRAVMNGVRAPSSVITEPVIFEEGVWGKLPFPHREEWSASWIGEVVFVPSDAVPFDEWERP